MDSQLNPKQIEKVEKIIKAYESGHLNEKILLKAVHNISDHHSNKVMEYLIILLVLSLGYLLSTGFFKMAQVNIPDVSLPEVSTSKINKTKLANNVYKGKDLSSKVDDSPEGSWDMVLMRDDEVVNVGIPSPCSGKIVEAVQGQGYGNTIAVDCQDYRYFIAHLAEKGLPVGTTVKEGDFIAIQGSTGNSTGEHIHLELSPTGTDKRITDRAITAPVVLDYISKIK